MTESLEYILKSMPVSKTNLRRIIQETISDDLQRSVRLDDLKEEKYGVTVGFVGLWKIKRNDGLAVIAIKEKITTGLEPTIVFSASGKTMARNKRANGDRRKIIELDPGKSYDVETLYGLKLSTTEDISALYDKLKKMQKQNNLKIG